MLKHYPTQFPCKVSWSVLKNTKAVESLLGDIEEPGPSNKEMNGLSTNFVDVT